MVRPMTTDDPFKDVVRAQMEAQGFSARGLAKRIAQLEGEDELGYRTEVLRRSLRRWLTDTEPSEANRIRVAKALGVDPKLLMRDPLPALLLEIACRIGQQGEREQRAVEDVARAYLDMVA